MAVSNSMFLQIATLKHVVKSGSLTPNIFTRISNRIFQNNICLYSTSTNLNISTENVQKVGAQKKMSKAMLAYLERAKAHDAFIKKEREDYLIGKRHLANMMGEDPNLFTQADVEKAIEYLFPSGIYDKLAKPVMKPPEEIFPPKKAAEFDETGRPYHAMFYTTRPNYFQALHDAVSHMEKLNDLEDSDIRKGVSPKPEDKMDLTKSDWANITQLEKILLEKIGEKEYEYFIASFDRLAEHPYSQRAEEFLMKFRIPRQSITQSLTCPELEYDTDGRPFITIRDCQRKTARGVVTVRGKGSGKITVNGQDLIRFFPDQQEREQVIFPLQFSGMLDTVDVEATVQKGGPSGQAGCIRWGIAWALRSFVDKKMMEKMRIAGLLTRDWRSRERKKPGQEGARRKFTWKKR